MRSILWQRLFRTTAGRVSFFIVFVLLGSLVIPMPHTAATSFPALELANGATLPGGGTLNVPMPTGAGGVSAGDLLVVVIASDDATDPISGICESAGWVSVGGLGDRVVTCGKNSDGTETTFSVSNPSGLLAGQSFRIAGWLGGTVNSGSISATAIFDSSGTSPPNPPTHNPSGWDVETTLWIAGAAMANNAQGRDFTTAPTGFENVRYDDGTQQSIISAQRSESIATMNPDAFGVTENPPSWTSWTVAIRPLADEPLFTLAATNVSDVAARMNGRLDVLFSASVSLGFRWGDTPSLGNWTANLTRSATGMYSILVTGLASETTYYFAAVSEEIPSGYSAQGATLNFTTTEPQLPFDVVGLFGLGAFIVLMIGGSTAIAFWVLGGRKKRGGGL